MRIKTQRADRIDRRKIHDHANERRQGDSPIKRRCGGARVHAYAAIDVIDWPGGFYRRDIGWWAFNRFQKGKPKFCK